MHEENTTWLPHLSSDIVSDARGSELDAYVIALEGWRRGLELKWHVKNSEKFKDITTWATEKPGKLFSLSSENKTHYFFKTRGDKVSNEAVAIAADKNTTKEHLLNNHIATPLSKNFAKHTSIETISEHVTSIKFPVVVKPTNGSFGKDVYTNIQNITQLETAINNVYRDVDDDVLVEQYIEGEDYRIYVVNDKVVGAIKRIPANIEGNGINTIKQLIDQKNERRKGNPRLISCPISMNQEVVDYVLDQGFSFEEVPAKGEIIYLSNKSNISIGGDPIDVLDTLDEKVKEAAIQAIHAVPALSHGAVDVIVQSNDEKVIPYILEINPTAQIGSLLFPLKGKARDVPAAIIDYYFPETINKGKQSMLYFDINDVLDPLISNISTATKVSKPPSGEIIGKKFIVFGDVQSIDYHRGLRKQAFERRISGFISKLHDGPIEIVVIGNNLDMMEEFKEEIKLDPERSTVESIEEETWAEPVKIGFEIKADLKTQLEYLKELNNEMNMMKKDLKRLESEYVSYYRSKSWKITYPFRKVSDLVKIFYRRS